MSRCSIQIHPSEAVAIYSIRREYSNTERNARGKKSTTVNGDTEDIYVHARQKHEFLNQCAILYARIVKSRYFMCPPDPALL